jgi:uncharacterized protein
VESGFYGYGQNAEGQIIKFEEKNFMSEKNKETVKQVNQAFSANNIEGFLELCSENVKWTMTGDKTVEGKDGIREFAASMGDMEPPVIANKNIIAEGDSVAAYGEMTMGGNKYDYCDVYQFQTDKIVELISYVVKVKDN